ncbi:MAG TPA: hypothetical protein PKY82_13940, partial [Pyrinomonadaceae bacterium]|nr:hypothetical protein [Pyrinomonadaceae bacterium]
MKNLLQICLLIGLSLIVINVKAQGVTAKEILAQAAKSTLDTEHIATANGNEIKGRLTAVKMANGQNEDLQQGFFAGILELEVKGDYGKLKTGKFNLFLKSEGTELNLYLEENGKISAILEATAKTPVGLMETKVSNKPELAFAELAIDEKSSQNFFQLTRPTIFSFYSANAVRRCKIYIKITL